MAATRSRCASTLLFGAVVATACATFVARGRAQEAEPSRSRSIGTPNRGRLENSVQVRPTENVLVQAGSSAFGTAELVDLIRRAADRLQESERGPRLLVGSLSARRGVRLRPHSSHQNGRDADLGFFVTDQDGHPIEPPRFLQLDESGCASDQGQAYCIDPRRTFLFVVSLLSDPVTRVQWILMAADLRQLVLAAGRRLDVDDAVYQQVEIATEPRDGSESHRSHMHVRIYCPVDDRPTCQDMPPFQSWYDGAPPRPAARPARHRRHRARHRRARSRRARRRAR